MLQDDSAIGTATFGATGNGRPGLVTFGVSLLQLWPRYEDLEIDDEAIADAASVLLGRTELQELTGQGFPSASANQVLALTGQITILAYTFLLYEVHCCSCACGPVSLHSAFLPTRLFSRVKVVNLLGHRGQLDYQYARQWYIPHSCLLLCLPRSCSASSL